jgi:Ala-tRNA(Pro) deacylase
MLETSWIHEFLHGAHVPYKVIPHAPAYTAREEAAAADVFDDDWAKVVACVVDGKPIQVVLPANRTIDLRALLDLTGGVEIRIADEIELAPLYPDSEVGAMPPFGPAYSQPVFADVRLALEPNIVFNAGTHTEAIAMRWADFARTVRPIVGTFSRLS